MDLISPKKVMRGHTAVSNEKEWIVTLKANEKEGTMSREGLELWNHFKQSYGYRKKVVRGPHSGIQ